MYSGNVEALNKQQRQAVESGDGPIAIIAGPGTGKTKTLAMRIQFLIDSKIAKPEGILALTFTKKSAQEMVRRVGNEAVSICTFHALCQKLLGVEADFISEQERLSIIKNLSKQAVLRKMSARELSLKISRAKNGAEHNEALDSLTGSYNQELKSRGVLDFDDLLLNLRDKLTNKTITKPKFTHILIDEFQDTNLLQYELLNLLRSTNNIFIIGDPRQSIYGFRGASSIIFDKFFRDFPNAKIINLRINYRSPPEIVGLGNAIFTKESQLVSAVKQAGKVQATEFLNAYSEAKWVVEQIQQAMGGVSMQHSGHAEAAHSLRDFAIIYRSRRAARAVQNVVAESGLPYQIVGDGTPYDNSEIQKIISAFKNASGETMAIGEFSALQTATLLQRLNFDLTPINLAEEIIKVFGIEKSPEVKQFLGTLVRFRNVKTAAKHFESISENNFYDPSAEVISLLTVHASKGLEFSRVFLVGATANVLPAENSEEPEERRLFYVAATRAKSQLDITYYGEPSLFITEIPNTILPRSRDQNFNKDAKQLQKYTAKKAQTSLF